MMDFETAWQTFAIGDPVRVSHKHPRPGDDSEDLRAWKAHNFDGVLAAKQEEPRALCFTVQNDLGNPIGLEIRAGFDHRFDYPPATIDATPALLDPALKADIDAAAGAARAKYTTDTPGQDRVYRKKEEQARAYLAAVDPVLEDYPAIVAEVAATGLEPTDAATLIVQRADETEVNDNKIETARRAATIAVTEATSPADKRAAAAVDWDAVLAAE